jgi:predicted site-specific integrase-resolvase
LQEKELRQTKKGLGAKSGALFLKPILAICTLLFRSKQDIKKTFGSTVSTADKLGSLLQLMLLWWLLLVASCRSLSQRAVDTSTDVWAVVPMATCASRFSRQKRGTAHESWLGHFTRAIRIVIYARFSTEEQDTSSIVDQIDYCKMQLAELGIHDPEFTIHSDEATSGELKSRPGINKVREGIESKKWDLLICEDISRLFRNAPAAVELVFNAHDQGLRVICINDAIDSLDDGWHEEFQEAAQDHAYDNKKLRARIKRKHFGLWKMGAAIGIVKTGYTHVPSIPASHGKKAEGPFYDQVVEQWRPIIIEVFNRIANGERPWAVAKYATEQGLPKSNNCKNPVWTDYLIKELIRRKVYRGVDEYRKKITKSKLISGKKFTVHNNEDLWVREMPHLRIVDDVLWYAANKAIDDRYRPSKQGRGEQHRAFGIPRDTRRALSQNFVCGICGSVAHVAGRTGSAYRCSLVKPKHCWNHVTAERKLTLRVLGEAISNELFKLDGAVDYLVTQVHGLWSQKEAQQDVLDSFLKKREVLAKQQTRVLKYIREEDDAPGSLTAELRTIEKSLSEITAEIEHVRQRGNDKPELTKEKILELLDRHRASLLEMNPEVSSTLGVLIPKKIRIVPYLQYTTMKVVPRAEFELHLTKLLPFDTLVGLDHQKLAEQLSLEPIKMLVDLFVPSFAPKHAWKVLKVLEEEKLTFKQLGKRFDTDHRNVFRAVKLARAMREAGISDPFIRLAEAPDLGKRWRLKHE